MITSVLTSLDLTPYQIRRPEKIRWIFPTTDDVLLQCKSKGLRSFLGHSEEIFQEKNIRHEYKILNRQDFLEWLPYYQQKMHEQEHDVLATIEWFDQKQSEGAEVSAFFFYQNTQLIGSAIQITESDRITLVFKASDRIELSSRGNSNLGSAIEYVFLKEAAKTGKIISSGTSRNAFGVINNFGYLDFKLRFGYQPEPNLKYPLLDIVPIDEQRVVAFLGLDQDKQNSFYLLHSQGADVSSATEVLKKTSLSIKTIFIPQSERFI